MKPLSRRTVIAGSAAAVTVLPALGLCKDATEGGELAALVRRWLAEADAFDAWCLANDPPDRQCNARANATYNATARQMIGVPARTAEDALAAMDWLLKEGVNLHEHGDRSCLYSEVATSLVDSIRGYLEGRVA